MDERHHEFGCVLVLEGSAADEQLPGSEVESVGEGGVSPGTFASADVPSASEKLARLEHARESGRGHLAHDGHEVGVAQDVAQERFAAVTT
jgi:hypothetical protein